MHALLGTHHLHYWSGSEIVIIEIAEALAEFGFAIDIYAPFIYPDFATRTLPDNFNIITLPEEVDLGKYNLVYIQHQVLSRILPYQSDEKVFGQGRPLFLFNHLSTVEPFEIPGPFVEVDVADLIWTQSPKTVDVYRQRYHSRFMQAMCVPNPAPSSFQADGERQPAETIGKILSVSNHLPQELNEAFSILDSRSIKVTKVGGHGNNRRLLPGDVLESDCLVTIGKSVQYGIRAKKPVYCYDHFGGPGWLSEDNFAQTSYRNFSGLNDSRKRSAGEIADDIVGGYIEAAAFAASLENRVIESYVLERYIDDIVRQVKEHIQQPRPLHVESQGRCDRDAVRARWFHEAQIYTLIDREYGFNTDRII